MRVEEAWIGVVAAVVALSVGCLPKPYTGDDPGEPADTEEQTPATGAASGGGAANKPAGSSGGTGTSAPSSGSSGGSVPTTTPSPAPSAPPLEPGEEMIHEVFTGTPKFTAKQGTLAVVANGTAKAGRVCADTTGVGGIEATIGPVSAGTYTITASVRQDTSVPGKTWTVDATSYSPGPDAKKAQGDLATTVQFVKSTVQVKSGAFAAVFGVRLGTTANTCMLVDDIRVVKAP